MANPIPKFDTILVLDFGGQYCHLIARRVRDQRVYSEIVPCDISPNELLKIKERLTIRGIILSGGPASVYSESAPHLDPQILELDIPILGLCYGHQLIAHMMHGRVTRGTKREYGSTIVTIEKPFGILSGLDHAEEVWMSHYDTVYSLPKDFEVLAHTENCPVAAFRHTEKHLYGLQWHPEVSDTQHGTTVLQNFIFNICKCKANWEPSSIVEKAIGEIKRTVGEEKAIIALSGGIDSSTAALLASEAIGKNLIAVFVDHGFMREGEPEFVERIFAELDVNIILIHARERFLKKIGRVTDPERKRKIIGHEFIKVFEEIAEERGAKYLIQGTIYPDRIESGIKKHSETIKSHHNVAGLPTQIKFKAIIEPLKDLYKDEVREIAKSLCLRAEILFRQPFPGPGLAVRIIGKITHNRLELLRKADNIVTEEIEKNRVLKATLWQYFAVLTDTKSTGVRGDSRAYGDVLAIRVVTSREAMTASFAKVPYELLEKISTRITNELPQITRVVYDITHKPPGTIEWE
ncbi:MAG: glutamine-hydrolyzing GMP synthase [Candidatus Bathyarchaeota archaeon]